jgi:predicted metal-dependent phosphoesterase TrpH
VRPPRIDLHTHTTASDGALEPAELVTAALARGLTTIAVTDHDTVAGIVPSQAAARGTGLTVLPGVELSARLDGRQLHLLGYGIDPTSRSLLDALHDLAERRVARARAMVEKLASAGVPISWDDVAAISRGVAVGRPHIAEALVRAGYAANVSDAFARYVGDNCPAYIPSSSLTPAQAVEIVRAAGGQVALAHPLRRSKPLALAAILPDLKHAGISGLEVYHSEHDPEAAATLLEVAAREAMWWSGGSDFHGPSKPNVELGGVDVPPQVLDQGPFRHAG